MSPDHVGYKEDENEGNKDICNDLIKEVISKITYGHGEACLKSDDLASAFYLVCDPVIEIYDLFFNEFIVKSEVEG